MEGGRFIFKNHTYTEDQSLRSCEILAISTLLTGTYPRKYSNEPLFFLFSFLIKYT